MRRGNRFLGPGGAAICLSLLLSGAGCRSGGEAYKDGEKFPAATPPPDYVAERMRLRSAAPPPGAQPSPGAAVPKQP